jgi:hypothetical protein
VFQSTDANIFKVERDGASKQVTIMIGVAPAMTAPKVAAKKKESLSDDDISDEE